MMKTSRSLLTRLLIGLLLLTLLPLTAVSVSAEDAEDTDYIVDETEVEYLFSVQARSEDHIMQGFAAYGGVVFQLHDGGRCTTYHLETGTKISEFHLGSFYTHNHCGNANFGKEFPEGNTDFPALYVSGDLTTKACYVENVTATSAELIQTIYFDIDPSYTGGQVILDHARDRIVYMQREKSSIKDMSNVYRMCEFPIPSLDAGAEIHYTNADMLGEPYVLPFYPGIYQGAVIYGNTILQTHGYSGTATEYGAKVGMVCYDTATHAFTHAFDLTGIIDQEPQGTFVYEGRLYMNFVNGKVYEIKPKLTVKTDGYDMICVENEAQILDQLSGQIPTPYRLLSAKGDAVLWNSRTGEFQADVTLQTPYNELKVTLTGHALTHPWGEYRSNGNATCTENGTQTRTCTHAGCGRTETVEEMNSALGHAWGDWRVTSRQGASADRPIESACTRCGETQAATLKAVGLGTLEIVLITTVAILTLLALALTATLLYWRRKR